MAGHGEPGLGNPLLGRMTKSSGMILIGPSVGLGPAGPPGVAERSKSAPADFVDGDSRPEGASR